MKDKLSVSKINKRIKVLGINEINSDELEIYMEDVLGKVYEQCNTKSFPNEAIPRLEQMVAYHVAQQKAIQGEIDTMESGESPVQSISIENTTVNLGSKSVSGNVVELFNRKYEEEFLSFVHRYRKLVW